MKRVSQKSSFPMRLFQVHYNGNRFKIQGSRSKTNLPLGEFGSKFNAIPSNSSIDCQKSKLNFYPAKNEKGFVLIVVMLVIALLFPIVLTFNARTQVNLLQAGNFKDNVQALRLARSGVEGAMGILKMDNPDYDAKTDTWAMVFPAIGVGDGKLTVDIVDEDSKININQLVESNGINVNVYVENRLRRLVARLGGEQEMVDALIDWMDANNEPFGRRGAEDEYYKTLGYHTKNGPLDSLDELYLVRGFDKDLLVDKNLKNYITVAPTDGKINVNTAKIDVLYDIHVELREGLIEEIVSYRDEKEFRSIVDVKNTIGITDNLYAKILPYIKVNSTIFTVHSKYTLYKVTKNVDALLKRDGKKVAIISWREY